ncbi:hypothetical protein B9Z55_027812 [Caenorhabditis nigoni]|uniref:SPK domain-containing protein n=1 Tax=Caenorhabditis nigoni TaxID=1611254 RepID=A0A2G5SEZ6_9PELO|nr:hypothetical protein B9Z55_027812 [Caenorhabditis nigoni]
MISTQRYYDAFKYIAENVKEYKNPENLTLWREECKKEMPDIRELLALRRAIDRRLYKIATTLDAEGYTFLEKVHLVFIFSRPVSDEFVKIVQKEKCTIKLDRENRIKYFRSEDGSVVLSSNHKKEERFFKGTVLTSERKRTLLSTGISKKVRPSQPIVPEPSKNSNMKLENLEDEAPTYSQTSEYFGIQNGPFNGRIDYDELDEQELDGVTALNEERSFDRKPEKRHQNSWSSENAKKVKTEEWDEDFFAVPDAPETLNNAEEPKISVLLLANQIGIIALYCSLEGVQKKASQAIEIIKMKRREMTLNVADFNSFIDSMLKSIKRSRIQYSHQTENVLPLKTVYRHIKLSLVLPFGPEVTGEALKIVDNEIEELGESQDEVPLETIRRNLEYLLNSSTGFWI